jgi:hypothetical protein
MADIRERVVEDRGLFTKIQAMIPGFSGYRAAEDIRAADNMLRIQVADRLAASRKGVEECRAILADNLSLDNMDRVGTLLGRLKAVEGEIRHAEHGYSGVSAKLKVGEAQLNRLYEYDFMLLTAIGGIDGEIPALKAAAVADDQPGVKTGIAKVNARLVDMEGAFKNRMNVITNTEA